MLKEKMIEAYERANKTNEPIETIFEIELTESELDKIEEIKEVIWWEMVEGKEGTYLVTYNPEV